MQNVLRIKILNKINQFNGGFRYRSTPPYKTIIMYYHVFYVGWVECKRNPPKWSIIKFILKCLLICLLPINSFATGWIENISFENSKINIHHHDCQIKETIETSYKLIIKIGNCFSKAGIIKIKHPNLQQIHWAQHDHRQQTVWVVATFAIPNYQFARIKLSSTVDQISISNNNKTMFLLKGIRFQIPLENMDIEKFIDRSIGYIPKFLVKDGLPHFGSKRDDWKRKTRKHKGYDIYVNNVNVIAAADGIVTKVRTTSRAGLYVKLRHAAKIYTLYIHLTSARVKRGQAVKRGQILGRIDGASGNAIEAQLHFEIKPYNKSINPLALIENYYDSNHLIIEKIRYNKQLLTTSIRTRNIAVRNFLQSHR